MAVVSSDFEAGTDHHVNWFSGTVVQSTADFHSGAACLSVTVGAGFTGVQLDNHPYYSGVTAGNSYDFSIWVKQASGSTPTVQWKPVWYDSSVLAISTDTITITLTGSWAQTTATLTAPTGAVTLGWSFETAGAGVVGSELLFDDLLIQDTVVATVPRSPIVAPTLAATQAASW